jgi:hypothetical protein
VVNGRIYVIGGAGEDNKPFAQWAAGLEGVIETRMPLGP